MVQVLVPIASGEPSEQPMSIRPLPPTPARFGKFMPVAPTSLSKPTKVAVVPLSAEQLVVAVTTVNTLCLNLGSASLVPI
jgi:hypothetical protein